MERHRSRIGRVTLVVALMASLLAATGGTAAQVPEQVFQVQVLHVNNGSGNASDDNPGTTDEPLETLGEAAARARENNRNATGTRIVIHPGTYRESVVLGRDSSATEAPISFEAAGRRKPIVSGSDIWTGWKRKPDTDIFTHHWPHKWGQANFPAEWPREFFDPKKGPLLLRREMVFANGRLLRQVLSLRALRNRRGAFFVSEDQETIYVRPPKRIRMRSARIEVAVRPRLLTVESRTNITVRGLAFRHANSPLGGMAVTFDSSTNLLVENSKFVFNNWEGLKVRSGSNNTLRTNKMNRNGVGGMSASRVKELLLEGNATSFNNWRGWWANWTTFSVGNKFFRLRDARFVNHRAIGNKSDGIFLDFDNERILFDRVVAKRNFRHGLFLDVSQGPITVRRSILCNNRDGIHGANTEKVTVRRNIMYNNTVAGIVIGGSWNGPITVDNHETGEEKRLWSRHWSIRRNLIAGRGNQLTLATITSERPWRRFVRTLDSDRNFWHSRHRRDIFGIVRGGSDSPPGEADAWPIITLKRWKRYSGEDSNSRFRNPFGYRGLCSRRNVNRL